MYTTSLIDGGVILLKWWWAGGWRKSCTSAMRPAIRATTRSTSWCQAELCQDRPCQSA